MTARKPTAGKADTADYSQTLFLPQTDFPMRAGLPQKEPELLARWQREDLYGRLRYDSAGRPKFVLHDGPPYANGNIHIGTALNKILKDIVTRSQQMLGFDSNYVPGWDCHGLPIEWKIEEQYRAEGKDKDAVPVVEFRRECRAFAEYWLNVQREEFKRLGVIGDWDNPYSTMSFPAEAQIARELMTFAMTGQLYRGSKPVMWSVVEKTALAEAEVEYEDYTSDTVWVKFPVLPHPSRRPSGPPQDEAAAQPPHAQEPRRGVSQQEAAASPPHAEEPRRGVWKEAAAPPPHAEEPRRGVSKHEPRGDQDLRRAPRMRGTHSEAQNDGPAVGGPDEPGHGEELAGAAVVIWTTTPWTIPGNRAICFSSKIAYGLYEVTEAPADNWAKVGDRLILADRLAEDVFRQARVQGIERLEDVPPGLLAGLTCTHPLRDLPHAEEPRRGVSKHEGGGYAFPVPLFDADHVADDVGTGFVHTAPGHGREDFDVWMANARHLRERGIPTDIPYTVDENGAFTKDAPGFEGKRILTETGAKGDANEAVITALAEAGMLLARGKLKHQYPHSWRSKKPVIFRNTPQWFIAMDRPITDALLPSPLPAGERPAPLTSPLPSGERSTPKGHPTAQGAVGTPQASGEGRGPASASAPHPLAPLATSPRGGEVGGGSAGASAPLPTSPRRGEVAGGAPDANALPDTLRNRALQAIRDTRWVPPAGENRITGMIENRPDWVVSRQRAWGVPITVFVHRRTGELLKDERVNERIAAAFEAEGADAWFGDPTGARFLAPDHDPVEWEKVTDVLDVWFDSGSTHAYTLEDPKHFPGLAGIRRVRDGGPDTVMYLEGSDQHRGWFHSSLLESCGTRGRAPYDVVLTHGFVLDEDGRKMSKSLGNTVAPQDVIAQSGADILRLWVAASDFTDDLRIGPEILKVTVDTYRKLRNTLRWMLGSLAHFRAADRVAVADMPELERLMLHRLAELEPLVREAYAAFDYKRVFAALNGFMTSELSAFYFDIRKDTLYCDPISSVTRKAALTVIDELFRCLVTWLAPILSFTAEEAWLSRFGPPHPEEARSAVSKDEEARSAVSTLRDAAPDGAAPQGEVARAATSSPHPEEARRAVSKDEEARSAVSTPHPEEARSAVSKDEGSGSETPSPPPGRGRSVAPATGWGSEAVEDGAPAPSVHLEPFRAVPAAWRDDALAERWEAIRRVRRVVTGALEVERAAKRIGASLEADPIVHIADPALHAAVSSADMALVCITSGLRVEPGEGPPDAFRLDDVPGVAVVPARAVGKKCARSWKITQDVGADPEFPDVTLRDAQALREWAAARAAA